MRLSVRQLAGPAVVVSSLLLCSLAAAAAADAPRSDEASPALRPAWSLQLDGEVEWQRVAPLGQLLVKTSRGLSGLDPERGKVLWTHADLGGLGQDEFDEIPGTTFVVLSDGVMQPRVVILDSVDGRIIFDSRRAGVSQVLSRHFLPQSRQLLLFGFQEGDPATTMFLVDVESGQLRWKNNRLLEGKGKVVQALAAFFQSATKQSGIVGEPMEITPDTFLVASVTDLYAVRTLTGEISWRVLNTHDASMTRFHATERAPGVVFVGSETTMSSVGASTVDSVYSEYRALRMTDGAAVWPKPVQLKGGLNDVIFTDKGLILSSRTTGKGKILLCDYGTGVSHWGKKGKGLEILGGIINHDWTRAGLVLTTGYDSAWTDKGTQYHLTLLDVERGALRFEEPLRLRGRILSTQVIPAGLLFTTTSEVNILDLKTGQPLLGEGVRSDESLVTTIDAGQLYAYAGLQGALHRLDLERGTLATLSKAPVRLEEDEAPLSIEAGRDRITVISNQNIIVWKPDGELGFHAYHPSPRLPVLMQVLLRAQQVRMGMAAAAAGMASVSFAAASTQTEPESLGRAVTASVATGYADASQQLAYMSARYGEAARTRFKATTAVPGFVFMMVKHGKGHGLARVSKAAGRIEAVIDLGRDKDPIYEVDAISNLIFYRSGPSTVTGYRF